MEESAQTKLAHLQAELDSLHKAITVLNQLAAELDIHTAMQNVRQVALELLDCERVTLFLIFERRQELRAIIEQGEILRIKFGEGIAGLVAQTGGSMNVADVYSHPMFNKEVDRATGFRTRSMLCMAVSDMTGKNVAVLQALNKNSGQPFKPADERHLRLFGTHLGNTLVKAKLHETAKREKERLTAIYTCFKSLSAADEVSQMVVCATAALERHIIHADRVFFFLVDSPRGELWLHTHQAEPVRLRMGEAGGVVGLCAESKRSSSWAEFTDASSDPALRRLAPLLGASCHPRGASHAGGGPARSSAPALAAYHSIHTPPCASSSSAPADPTAGAATTASTPGFSSCPSAPATGIVMSGGAGCNSAAGAAGGAAAACGPGCGGGGGGGGGGGPARVKSVLVQPIQGSTNSKVLAVVLAVNKREAEGTNDIFFEPFFTDADCRAMELFAYEVGDLLSERTLELSLMSALSVVGHNGAHPNAQPPAAAAAAGGEAGAGGGAGGTAGGGGGGADGGGGGGLGGGSSASGDEDFLRSQLIQMYLPEFKKEGSASHSSVFNRSSFSTASQVRASLERRRNAFFAEAPSRRAAGASAGAAAGGAAAAAAGGCSSSGGGAGGASRHRNVVSVYGRLGNSGLATRGSLWGSSRMQNGRSVPGFEDPAELPPGSAPSPQPPLPGAAPLAPPLPPHFTTTAAATATPSATAHVVEPAGPPSYERGSDPSGTSDPMLPDLASLRCASSTLAEQTAAALRASLQVGGATACGGGSGGCGGVLPARSSMSLSAGAGVSGAAAVQALLLLPVQRLPPELASRLLPLPALPRVHHQQQVQQVQGQGQGQQSKRTSVGRGASASGGVGGAAAGVTTSGGGLGRLMASWRRPAGGHSGGGGGGGGGYDSGDGGAAAEAEKEEKEEEYRDRFDDEEAAEEEEADGEEEGALNASAQVASAAAAGAAGASVAAGAADASSPAGLLRAKSRRRVAVAAVVTAGGGEGAAAAAALPEPFAAGLNADVLAELRAAAEATALGASGVADLEALRSHLSCSNLVRVDSCRSPCFHPEEQLRSWDWDFTQYGTEELIKLSYDIFTVSGALDDFALSPKTLRNFLTAVASHYHDIPYHNFNHVCHVLHATFLIATTTRVREVLTPLERLSLLLAALCHDLDHDGNSNSFHVNSGSAIARIYNDQSVMENHHCAMAFAILSRADCDITQPLSHPERRALRKAVIAAILCTDMANHFALTQEFQKHGVSYEPDNESDRMLLLKVILHAADIGNAVRPFHVNHAMSRRVHAEFESQAATEVRLGLPVTFAVDTRDHVMCARVELNFLDYVVTSLWERLVEVLPELAPQLAQLRTNRTRYRKLADTGKTAEQVVAEEEEEQRQQQQQEQQQQQQLGGASGVLLPAPLQVAEVEAAPRLQVVLSP